MRFSLRHLVAAVLVTACLCSCGREGKVIPRSKMARIYAEMFLADAWLMNEASPVARYKTDTMAFYEPIFEEYGYTVEDYWASVSHYLLDPDRFSRIVKRSNALLTAELKALQKAQEEEASRPLPREATMTEKVFEIYGRDFKKAFGSNRINLQLDSNGRYVPILVIEDTMFFGPRMIIAADSLKAVSAPSDTVATPPEPVRKPLRRPAVLERKLPDNLKLEEP